LAPVVVVTKEAFKEARTTKVTKKPQPPKPVRWGIYKLAAKQTWIDEVEVATEAEAIEKTAGEFKGEADCGAAMT
jgi:hypothetical protein